MHETFEQTKNLSHKISIVKMLGGGVLDPHGVLGSHRVMGPHRVLGPHKVLDTHGY